MSFGHRTLTRYTACASGSPRVSWIAKNDGAFFPGARAPFWPCRVGSFDGDACFGRSRPGNRPDHFAGGRIVDGDGGAIGRGNPVTADIDPFPKKLGILQEFADGVLNRGGHGRLRLQS